VLADGGEAGPSDAALARRQALRMFATAGDDVAAARVLRTADAVIRIVPLPAEGATKISVTDIAMPANGAWSAPRTRVYTERMGEGRHG
jgi:hypothetical protein